MRILELNEKTKSSLLNDLLKRSPNNYKEYEDVVEGIVNDVRARGDEALFEYTLKFDKCKIDESNVEVTKAEIEDAYKKLDNKLIEVLKKAASNIRSYHELQKRNSWINTREDGVILGQKITAIEKAGVYVPGGTAAYPSSVLMNIIPAKVAGVEEIIMLTPPNKDGEMNPATLVAADIAGVDRVFKAGGAQAIAAMAFGTKSIPKVYKITGPGNIFVALAKRSVFGYVSIDSIAGPSEVMVLCDETANPEYVAADLLSQAEHDKLASAILVTTSKEMAEKVSIEIDKFTATLERKEIIEESLNNYGYALVAKDMASAIDAVNEIASEHLEILTANPFDILPRIKNAGAIFLGEYSSEPLGDYFAGPNHILPTNGTAKFFSPLGVDDFIKKSSIISYSREALKAVHEDIELFAKQEGLTAHANSINVRFR